MTFSQTYPTITRWIDEQGYVEIGDGDYSDSLARALDPGGMIWESSPEHKTVDEALIAMEKALQEWFEENE